MYLHVYLHVWEEKSVHVRFIWDLRRTVRCSLCRFHVAFVTIRICLSQFWSDSMAYPGSKPANKAGTPTYQPTDKLKQKPSQLIPVGKKNPSWPYANVMKPTKQTHRLAKATLFSKTCVVKSSNGQTFQKKNCQILPPPTLKKKTEIHGNPSQRLCWPTKKN